MARSLKKGPFVHFKLAKKLLKNVQDNKKTVIKTWSRASMITPDFVGLLPYVIAFLSCLCAFQFPLTLDEEKGTWNHFEWKNKNQYFCLSLVLMLISTFLGVYFDDPIMSTAGAVCIPFPLITLIWPNHVRHLQRARFFPLFTFSMFLCVRAPWFFFPLWILPESQNW